MPLDAWLPIGFATPDGEKVQLAQYEGVDWQIYDTQGGGHLLLAKDLLAEKWLSSGLLENGSLQSFSFAGKSYFSLASGMNHTLAPLADCKSPDNKNQALSFAEALRSTRFIEKSTSLHDAIYAERLSRLLPTYSLSPQISDDVVFGSWLSGGVPVSVRSFRRLRSLVGWMGAPHLADVIRKAGFELQDNLIQQSSSSSPIAEGGVDNQQGPRRFLLAGRPELEQFINEHVVDIIVNEARYKALGIDFPSAIILHGPPGCGKTFAVERLIDFLGWPSFEIEASSVASPYIHETSKKVAEVFDKAMQNAPSTLIIDEMEAFLADRQMSIGTSHHRVEEVAEFLRRIPEAIKNHVLIIAMTNRIDMIDSAILRRGRFDHVIKVDMASAEEVSSLLNKLLSELPNDGSINVHPLAEKLAGRPLSDVAFIVREGARLAARSGKDKIGQENLLQALEISPSRGPETEAPRKKMGFL